jgi:hypothetical protein
MAIWTATFRRSANAGNRDAEESLRAGEFSARARAAARIIVLSPVVLVGVNHLLIKGFDVRRQKSVQSKRAPFVLRERCAFVQPLAVQEVHPARDIWPT